MHRLIARVCAQAGRLDDAIEQAGHAAVCFEKAGDFTMRLQPMVILVTLYRETGDFEKAK